MKKVKFISLIIGLAIVTSIIACDRNKPTDEDPDPIVEEPIVVLHG